jgi:hypothetical protein
MGCGNTHHMMGPQEFACPADASATAGWRQASLNFRVWRAPAFESSVSWAVVHVGDAYLLRRTVWDTYASARQNRLHAAEVPLDRSVFNCLDAELAKVVLP